MKKVEKGISQREWEKAAGVACPNCGVEAMRLIDGICFECYNEQIMERDKKTELKREKRYFQGELTKGKVSMGQLKKGRL